MRILKLALPIVCVFVTGSCSQPPSGPTTMQGVAASGGTNLSTGSGAARVGTLGSTPLTATVQFGLPDVGSPFPPPSGHDQSVHAKDNLVPRTVVIRTGGTVTFNTFGVHQVTIYDDGTEPEDINTSSRLGTPCLGGAPLLINDANNRLAVFDQPCAGGPVSPSYTFNQPGRYLVICAFLPHFEVQMWGWVIVKE